MKNLITILFDKTQKQFYLVAFGYLALFVSIYYILYSCGIITAIPNSVNLINWDANWYQSIRDKNYEYFWFMASNSALFPLFSYCWKLLGLSSVGISVFNLFLFLVSLNLLYRTFSITQKHLLLYLSLPSVLFFGVPMSESFFFFFCTLFLIGLKKDNVYLIVFGLLFASLTRATAMFPVFSGPKPRWIQAPFREHADLVSQEIANLVRDSSNPVNAGQIAIIVRKSADAERFGSALRARNVASVIIEKGAPLRTTGHHVHIVTAHSSKGLGFPVVFVPEVRDDVYPSRFLWDKAKDPQQREQIEENEQRLLYVALSRASHRLFMVVDAQQPSPFVNKLDRSAHWS